ncbi:TonB-dependent receptor [Chitinophaga qingshengii]|uniref:TonB-dependent receptor n=1 Tax=Chitinophaga qingshengii TaxID=1569794 RepID=A0ABR7TGC8_9BACT|nr:TonB-dependent receptor [Chitinophaga qingshengii]MBC9928995.1 TonB-dependent receptor [Chitinophaga qingshengii]
MKEKKISIIYLSPPGKRLLSLYIGLLLLLTATGYGQQNDRITVAVRNESLKTFLNIIEKKTEYRFTYRDQIIPPEQNITLSVSNIPIDSLLNRVLRPAGLTFNRNGNTFAITQVHAPSRGLVLVSGIVRDETANPVKGVSISAKSVRGGAVTGDDGRFSLNVPEGSTLEASCIGYIPASVSTSGKNNVEIMLQRYAKNLEDVVVVGFATQKKVNLTGAVGTVDMKEMASRPVRNATQMLQGLVPGLNISQSTGGGLDNNPTINIRGVTTIGIGSSGSPLILIDGMEADINSVNPNDIDNISVLKDASTASIYGSRAAFGVVLVTTKKGKTGKSVISYNNNFRLNQPVNTPHMADSYQFALYFNDAAYNSGTTPLFSDERIQRIRDFQAGSLKTNIPVSAANPKEWAGGYNEGNDNIDWYKALYDDNTLAHEHNLSVSGGTDKLRYYVSGNYLDQKGLIKLNKDGYERYTATAKLNSQLKKWAQLNYALRYVHETNAKPYYLTASFFYDLARQGWPVLPLYDPNGYLFAAPSPALNLRDGGRISKQTDWYYHQVQVVLEPVKNWKTFAELNYRQRFLFNHSDQQITYNHDVDGNPYTFQPVSLVSENVARSNFFNTNIYSEYTTSINRVHNLKFMLGYQNELSKNRDLTALRNGIILPSSPVLDLTSGVDANGKPVVPKINGVYDHWATAGIFERINYNYKNKYLLEFNMRYDGTSRFREDKRWNWFPSVSLGWNLASEPFMDRFHASLDVLKLRASYGKLGNQNTNSLYPTYQTIPYTTSGGAWLINNLRPNTSSAPALISSSLSWEQVESWNAGADISLFRDRLSASVDYYIRNTRNMIGPAPELPVTLGTAVPLVNNTDLRTKGWEASAAWRDEIGKLRYNLKFSIANSTTVITNYPNVTGVLGTYRTGQQLGEIWGYETIGIARSQQQMNDHLATLPKGGQNAIGSRWEAGDIMYRDLNNDGKIDGGAGTVFNPGDMRIIGNSLPRMNYAFNIGAEWKGISIDAFFQGVMKREVYTDSYFFWGIGQKGIWWSTAFDEHMNYFRENPNHPLGQNLDSYYPRPLFSGGAKNQLPQTRYLQDASYIRLKNLQLGYTLPASMLQKIQLSNLRLYISCENLWTGTRLSKIFDPETIDGQTDGAVVYPLFRVMSAGCSVTF